MGLILALACARPAPSEHTPTIGPEDRPATVYTPQDWDGETPLPVVFLLHGLGGTSEVQDRYLGFSRQVDELDFLLVTPDGLRRKKDQKQAWNATDYCCAPKGPDDVAYLSGLIDELEQMPTDGIHFAGHSNGGFMSYRMACEDDRVEAIASLAGSTFLDPADCRSPGRVDVLQIHGTADLTVPYEGKPDKHPGAEETAQRWADRHGCDAGRTAFDDRMNLARRPGKDTTRTEWRCPDQRVELWTMDAAHIPLVNRQFSHEVVSWLLE